MDVVRTRRALYIGIAAGLLGATALAASSCSSKSSGTFASGDDGPAGDDGGGGASSGSSGGGSSSGGSGTSSGLNLGEGGTGTGMCKDGMYAGMYACSFNYNPGSDGGVDDAGFNDAGFIITGNISFQLTQDQSSGESFLDMASGSFGGGCCAIIPGMPLFSLDAGLTGQLNCHNGMFTGMLSDGTYTGFGMMGTFSGPLDSQYGLDDAGTYSFVNGTWNLTVPGQGTCDGIWSATLQ